MKKKLVVLENHLAICFIIVRFYIFYAYFLGFYVIMLRLPLSFFFGKANAAFGINLCKVYMNDDPKMTMTYIMANSNVVICVLEWGLLNVLNR